MHPRYELIGKVFGRLTVTDSAGTKDHATQWLCQCECGSQKIIAGKSLVRGLTRSCGCKQGGASGLHGAVHRSHGQTGTPLHDAWTNIRQRCSNAHRPDWHLYGGRGIRVCDEWKTFVAFARDMGPTWKPGLTIERIDVNGHYEPGNCTWIPNEEQCRNRRSHGRPRREPVSDPAAGAAAQHA